MVYLLTTSQIETLQEIAAKEINEPAETKVIIFCKKTDTFKVDEVNSLLSIPGSVELIQTAGRDDMLVCLGGILATSEECAVLDPSIPVPDRYAGKVIHRPASKPRTTRRRHTKKEQGAMDNADEKGLNLASTGKVQTDAGSFMPKPELPTNTTASAEADEKRNKPGRRKTRQPAAETDVKTDMVQKETPAQTGLSPAEEGAPEFDDETGRKLYELLQIKSSDIEFTWPTSMLMGRIEQAISESDTDEDIEMAVKSIRNGELIWNKLKECLDQAKQIVRENP